MPKFYIYSFLGILSNLFIKIMLGVSLKFNIVREVMTGFWMFFVALLIGIIMIKISNLLTSLQTTRHYGIVPLWKILTAENSVIVPEKPSGYAQYKESSMAKVQKLLPRLSGIIVPQFTTG